MNPSPTAITAIASKVPTLPGGWAGNADAAIAGLLNTPSVANPAAQGTVPNPFSAADLINAASPANRAALASLILGSAAFIIAQDRVHMTAGITALADCSAIQAADATAMIAVLDATIPDPSWPAQLSWAQINLGRPVDTADITVSRPQS